MAPEVPSNLSHSVVVWFCKIAILVNMKYNLNVRTINVKQLNLPGGSTICLRDKGNHSLFKESFYSYFFT